MGFWALSNVWYSKHLVKTAFRKLDLSPFSGEGQTPTLLGPLERVIEVSSFFKEPNRVGVSLSPEDGNRSSF
jgi:hypothetical protein